MLEGKTMKLNGWESSGEPKQSSFRLEFEEHDSEVAYGNIPVILYNISTRVFTFNNMISIQRGISLFYSYFVQFILFYHTAWVTSNVAFSYCWRD
jgi:hypothetical protein